MKASQLRPLTDEQLDDTVRELDEEWRNLRFQESVGQLADTARIHTIRKDIARILTIKRERVLDAELQADLASTS